MKLKHLLLSALVLLTTTVTFAQEEWEPQTFVTGYVNTAAEYTDIDYKHYWNDIDPAIGLSEVALLTSYKPLSNLEFKGTLVYHNNLSDIRDLFVEAYGRYTFNEGFKVSLGKYLTPLSPVNQYFFAPLNTAASLPMLVSHHYLLPQSISGLQLSGEFGEDIKMGYNFTYGSYLSVGHSAFGMVGIQGREDILGLPISTDSEDFERVSHLGGSGRIYANYKGLLNLGLNYFDGRKSLFAISYGGGAPEWKSSSKNSYGVDVQLNLGSAKINGEYWVGSEETKELKSSTGDYYSAEFKGYYLEAMYSVGKLTPFVRLDYVSDVQGAVVLPVNYELFKLDQQTIWYLENVLNISEFDTQLTADVTSYTVGLTFRPIYEILLKAEYRHIMPSNDFKMLTPGIDLPQGSASSYLEDGSFNHYTLSLVLSF